MYRFATLVASWYMAPPSKNFFYVYVLQSSVDEKFYIGFTQDLKSRIKRHKNGLVPSTKTRLPVELIFYEAFGDKFDALRREKYLKSSKGKQTLRRMLKQYLSL